MQACKSQDGRPRCGPHRPPVRSMDPREMLSASQTRANALLYVLARAPNPVEEMAPRARTALAGRYCKSVKFQLKACSSGCGKSGGTFGLRDRPRLLLCPPPYKTSWETLSFSSFWAQRRERKPRVMSLDHDHTRSEWKWGNPRASWVPNPSSAPTPHPREVDIVTEA